MNCPSTAAAELSIFRKGAEVTGLGHESAWNSALLDCVREHPKWKGNLMRIPKHWTKASYIGADLDRKEITCSAWGWSFDSLSAAKTDALSRARRAFDCLVNGSRPDSYEYSDRPLREEIVDTLRRDGKEIAIITRNRYGALVLNSASVLFVDIDFPRIRPTGLWDALLLSLSRKRRQWRKAAVKELALESVRDWAQSHPDSAFRVYGTFAGLRVLFVDKLYEPNSDETSRILSELGSDPLYCTLTSKQECFRARLTPKPWRCRIAKPPNQYPWANEADERLYRTWEGRYDEAIRDYAVCELVEAWGNGTCNGEVAAVQELHDQWACDDGNGRKKVA